IPAYCADWGADGGASRPTAATKPGRSPYSSGTQFVGPPRASTATQGRVHSAASRIASSVGASIAGGRRSPISFTSKNESEWNPSSWHEPSSAGSSQYASAGRCLSDRTISSPLQFTRTAYGSFDLAAYARIAMGGAYEPT